MTTRRDMLKGLLAGFTILVMPPGTPHRQIIGGVLTGYIAASWVENLPLDQPRKYYVIIDLADDTATFYRQ